MKKFICKPEDWRKLCEEKQGVVLEGKYGLRMYASPQFETEAEILEYHLPIKTDSFFSTNDPINWISDEANSK